MLQICYIKLTLGEKDYTVQNIDRAYMILTKKTNNVTFTQPGLWDLEY